MDAIGSLELDVRDFLFNLKQWSSIQVRNLGSPALKSRYFGYLLTCLMFIKTRSHNTLQEHQTRAKPSWYQKYGLQEQDQHMRLSTLSVPKFRSPVASKQFRLQQLCVQAMYVDKTSP